MSLVLGMAFAALGFLALAAIVASFRQSILLVAELRGALRQPPPREELRLTVQDAALPGAETDPAPQPLPQPRPIARLLQIRQRAAEPA